jgi:hypothetical protein
MGKNHSIFPRDIGTFRFANIAVVRKYVTQEQVQNAIKEQEEDYVSGMPHRFLGEILMDNYLLTEEQVESILEEMGGGGRID